MRHKIILLVGVLALVGCEDSPPRVAAGPSKRPATTAGPIEYPCDRIGQICLFKKVGSSEFALAATSLKAYVELQKAIRAGDNDGIAELARTEEIIGAKPFDSFRVLDISSANSRIEGRITSGELKGRRVWVSTEWVKAER